MIKTSQLFTPGKTTCCAGKENDSVLHISFDNRFTARIRQIMNIDLIRMTNNNIGRLRTRGYVWVCGAAVCACVL